jgi:hypothetical protein
MFTLSDDTRRSAASPLKALSALLTLALALSACADTAVVGGETGPTAGTTEVPIGNNTTPPTGNTTAPPSGTSVLQAITPNQLFVSTGDQGELSLRYVANNITPVPNARISFELLTSARQPAPTGVDGSTLSAQNVNTDATGVAKVMLNAGQVAATMVVRASVPTDPSVRPIEWNVSVGTAGQGGLTFRVRYNPQMGRYNYNNFSSASVSLFNNITCEQLRDVAPALNGAWLALNDINPFNELDNTVSTAGVDSGLNLSAAAIIKSTTGTPLAFGCTPNIRVMDGMAQEIEINTGDLPYAFKGVYTAVHRFDMIDALQNSNGSLSTVGDVFDILRSLGGSDAEVGRAVVTQLCELIDLGDSCNLIARIGSGIVGRAINENLPPQLRNTLMVIGETLDIIGDLTLIGELDFRNNPNADGLISPNDNRWQRMRFNWEQQEREVTFGQLGTHSRNVAGVFDAQLEANGRVTILEHPFSVGYGSIILGLLESWIIPLVLNPQSGGSEYGLEQLLGDFIPCDDIEEAIGLDPGSELCDDILVSALSALLRDQVSRLNFEGDALKMTGEFLPTTLEGTLNVNLLTEGKWHGVINNDIEFDGCFVGCRTANDCVNTRCEILP